MEIKIKIKIKIKNRKQPPKKVMSARRKGRRFPCWHLDGLLFIVIFCL